MTVAVAAGGQAVADDLCAFIDASPSPYHAVAEAARMLEAVGFSRLAGAQEWSAAAGLTIREGSLVAWGAGADLPPHAPFRVVLTHTDSPNLRLRPRPQLRRAGWDLLGVEVYGAPLLNSWLDRDLGLSGRVAVRTAGQGTGRPGIDHRLVRLDAPTLRVAQLAVHLDRTVNQDGVRLNPQTQLVPIWGAGGGVPEIRELLAGLAGADPSDLLSWDVMTHDLTPAGRLGPAGDLLAAPRLDNLCSTFVATRALIDRHVGGPADPPRHQPVIAMFDHEEIGSLSNRGGQSQLLLSVLERLVLLRGGGRAELLRAMAETVVFSADMAHAVHPNYLERHEPDHPVLVNGGPVLKTNTQGRYATEAPGAAHWRLACEQAAVPMQDFVSRADMPCGSTVGPMTAALTGAVTVDVGAPMLSMHSARELCGAADPAAYLAALTAALGGG